MVLNPIKMFNKMHDVDIDSWNANILGYVIHGFHTLSGFLMYYQASW